jgi:CRISPR-associated exonuclease Cas4
VPEQPSVGEWTDIDPLPLSALNHLVFCDRRCALIHIEGVFVENASTLAGRLAHEIADTPGYSTDKGIRAVRALPLFSKRLRLFGRADIVEFHPKGSSPERPCPIDYKRGRRRRWDNDDIQLCAQALCLEEMLNVPVPTGAIFHASSKRRREVLFTKALRSATEKAVEELHALIARGQVPSARLLPRCEGCSLRDVCIPEFSQTKKQWELGRVKLFE